MNMFVFCHQVFRSKVFESENIFVFGNIYVYIYGFAKVSVYIYMGQDMTKGTLWLCF